MDVNPTKIISLWYHGGIASAAAACCTHPLDLLKVQLQTQQGSGARGIQLAVFIIRKYGFFSLYNRISASLGWQLTYSMTWFALYDIFKQQFVNNETPTMFQKMTLASIAGFCRGVVGTPCNLVNVRMQNEVQALI